MDVYFRFIQFSLGLYEGTEFLSGEVLNGFDWNAFYCFAKKQALVGVIFDGILKISKEVAPDKELLMTWFGQRQRIHNRNILLNETTAYIYNKLSSEGVRCCILKGQGNALFYPDPYSRTPGDIDVWVITGRDKLRKLTKNLSENNCTVGKESFNHIEMSVNGIAVELHSTPAIINNPVYNCHLQKWLSRNSGLQCSNIVSLPNESGDIAVPTCTFNIVYQLFHLYHHYFYEGIGLRQIIDYYFVLDNLSLKAQTNKDLIALQHDLKHLGLWNFVGAVMFVLHKVLGLSEDKFIAPMDDKRGGLLLAEILQGGNFGQYNERFSFGHGAIGHNLQRLYRDWRLMRYYPAEAISEPIFRTWHFFWRMKNRK